MRASPDVDKKGMHTITHRIIDDIPGG